jgi:AcrR family transcriptional regulator
MAKRPNDVITESITVALIQLLGKQEFHQITITDITKRAGVGRVSFYRNFESKEDVLKKYLETVTDEFIMHKNFDFRRDPHDEYIGGLFCHLEQHKKLIECLRKSGLLFLLKEEFDRAFLKRTADGTSEYACYMAAGAYYNLFYYWVLNGYQETPEELAKLKFSI